MYVAENNEIYYCAPGENGFRELFITVHETVYRGALTVEQQTRIIAALLNGTTTSV